MKGKEKILMVLVLLVVSCTPINQCPIHPTGLEYTVLCENQSDNWKIHCEILEYQGEDVNIHNLFGDLYCLENKTEEQCISENTNDCSLSRFKQEDTKAYYLLTC